MPNPRRDIAVAPVFLLGMPRSGTTWMSQIFEHSPEVLMRLSPNYSYPLKNMLGGNSSRADWEAQLIAALETDDPFMTQNWRREKGELDWIEKDDRVRLLMIKDTRFHELYLRGTELLPEAKCLFVVRHPCGHLNSWRKSKEFPTESDFCAHWREGACRKSEGPGEYWGFEDWKRLARLFLAVEARVPERVKVFRYEDLVARPAETTEMLFAFVGIDVSPKVTDFLVRSQARHDPNVFSVFRSPTVAGSWRTEFPKEIAAEVLAELEGTDLARFMA
ncbi:MAG: sulfotransferase [Proteobacteria bacterium]|nr:sulfotransferase [Pseudomonadota bacterium]